MSMRGARYLQIFVPCPLGWGSATNAVSLARYVRIWHVADVRSRIWRDHQRHQDPQPIPVETYMKPQRRFAHVFKKGNEAQLVRKLQNATSVNSIFSMKRRTSDE